MTLRNNKWEVNIHHQISCNFELHLGRSFNFKSLSPLYLSFIPFHFSAFDIATDVQLYLYALSNEQFIRRDISQIISGYRNYQKIRNNKRVLNNTLQHTIRHDIK